MGRKLISAKLDVVFKKFFTDNKDMLPVCFRTKAYEIIRSS